MAATTFLEMESGTTLGRVHPHNGYYAGDFSSPRAEQALAWSAPIPSFDDGLALQVSF
jgi:hypothetical protein